MIVLLSMDVVGCTDPVVVENVNGIVSTDVVVSRIRVTVDSIDDCWSLVMLVMNDVAK